MPVDSDPVTPWVCPDCQLSLPVKVRPGQRVYHDCTAKPPRPGLLSRAINYAQAVKRWHAAGCPSRSQEQIAYLLAEHCAKCSENVDDHCRACGCCVNSLRFPVFNKLAMATESCPLGHWTAEAETNHG